MTAIDDGDNYGVCEMYINENIATVTIMHSSYDSTFAYKAKTTFKITEYTQNTHLKFTLVDGIDASSSNIQELSNSILKLSVAGWDVLLTENGFTLKDINFKKF